MTAVWQRVFAGFMVLLPLFVTVYLLQLVFFMVDRAVGGWLTELMLTTGLASRQGELVWFLGVPFHGHIPVIGVLLLLLILLLIGGIARTPVGRHVFSMVERLFGFIPVARGVYSTVQQVSQALVHERSSFKQVVLVEYPRKGVYTVGFLTGESQGGALEFTGKEYVNVFLPKSPNPTNGWLALVPRSEVTFLDMSIEDGLKFVISGGVVPPKERLSEPTALIQPEES
ncbi:MULTISPECIES: DUF502 domain-containing protein [Brevibacillus]|jgi:uncharacterized membrane protein|uniref:DUF502 domain-containing protein n=1 Tax=Brevibacillus TaxID=55080 RepID=UPI001884A192|nr:DUF502 domain-containing protein [Brevibacillus borstelensis]MCC0564513.1 DUF502 domain-containing protein [Brevibacillus borstelensis]MCM3624975.1 DUF502 domain-containing protein [Brevibacillus borstelensis]MED1875276.1 DUF502 domain-containing protein [Brevibacillus borstelensis]MED1884134.1 DUF502 domain-containing protein [Brevibacillus borstelensis]